MGFYKNIVHKFQELPIAKGHGMWPWISELPVRMAIDLQNVSATWVYPRYFSECSEFSRSPVVFPYMFSPQPGGHGKNVMSISRSGGIRPSRSAFILWANPRAGGSCTMMNRQRCARSSSDRLESAKKVRVACWWSNVRVLIQQSNSPNIFCIFFTSVCSIGSVHFGGPDDGNYLKLGQQL